MTIKITVEKLFDSYFVVETTSHGLSKTIFITLDISGSLHHQNIVKLLYIHTSKTPTDL